jgi:hypothetical protein
VGCSASTARARSGLARLRRFTQIWRSRRRAGWATTRGTTPWRGPRRYSAPAGHSLEDPPPPEGDGGREGGAYRWCDMARQRRPARKSRGAPVGTCRSGRVKRAAPQHTIGDGLKPEREVTKKGQKPAARWRFGGWRSAPVTPRATLSRGPSAGPAHGTWEP